MQNRIWLVTIVALGLAVVTLTVLAQGTIAAGNTGLPLSGDVVVDRYGRARLLDREALAGPRHTEANTPMAVLAGSHPQQGVCSILIVDDDWEWDTIFPNDGGRPYYTSALDALGFGYDVWDIVEVGEPGYALVSNYDVVIWFTGYAWEEVIKGSNETVMSQYLDGGGRFILSSQDYFFDADAITPFMSQYLGIGWMEDDKIVTTTVGLAGDPIGNGLGPFRLVRPDDYDVYWPQGILEGPTDDEAYARAGAAEPFSYASPWNTNPNATSLVSDTFQTMFLGWPFEWVDTVNERAQVLGVALHWMGCDLPVPTNPMLAPIDNADGNAEYWLDWEDVLGATSYVVEEDEDPAFSSPIVRYDGPMSRFEVTQQGLGLWYYRVRAYNPGAGSGWSNTESATVNMVAPEAPVIAPIDNADGDAAYLVDWSDVEGASDYVLQEDDNPEFYSPVERYAGAESQLQVTNQPAGSWYYRVYANGAGGRSEWSGTAWAGVLPAAPVLLPISNPDGGGKYWVDWGDVPGAAGYTLEEDDTPGFGTPVVRYGGAVSRFQVIGQVGGTWYYRVQAYNAAGAGAWSNIEMVHVKPTTPILYPIQNDDGDGNYLVDWGMVTGAITYTLQQDVSAGFPAPVVLYSGGLTQFDVVGQAPGIWYYRVRASNAAGDSYWSGVQWVAVLDLDPPMLAAIQNPDGDGDYLVKWSAVTGATSYTLQEDEDPSFSSPIQRYRGSVTQYQVLGQAQGSWFYRVQAGNAWGNGPWSNTESVSVKRRLFLPLVLRRK